jgi:hypothetical protein
VALNNMKYCIHCGNRIATEAKFCSFCGKACEKIEDSNISVIKPYSQNLFRDYAFYFYNMGLNVTCISNRKNQYNSKADNIYLKAPNHPWEHLSKMRQTEEEFNSYLWNIATGFGLATGFNDLVAIDIDNCTPGFLLQTLELLNLPHDYEWIVLSGGRKGFHIYVFVDGITESFKTETVIRLFPKIEYKQEVEKTELLVRLHSILPPSLHPSKNAYMFVNCEKPNDIPQSITFPTLQNFVDSFFDSTKQRNMHKYKQKKESGLKLLQKIGKLLGVGN